MLCSFISLFSIVLGWKQNRYLYMFAEYELIASKRAVEGSHFPLITTHFPFAF